jgi:hypothetical protein
MMMLAYCEPVHIQRPSVISRLCTSKLTQEAQNDQNSLTRLTRLLACSAVVLTTSICLSLAVGTSAAFADKKIGHHSTARAQAPVVSPYPAPVYPTLAPVDPLYAACGDMHIASAACPGH